MTADTTSFTRLRCDARGCTREFPENAPLQGGAAFTRKRAAAAGWLVPGFDSNLDLCPEHEVEDAFAGDLNPQGRIT